MLEKVGWGNIKAIVLRSLELKRNLKDDTRAASQFQQMAAFFQVGGE